jgi:hypothetical protein
MYFKGDSDELRVMSCELREVIAKPEKMDNGQWTMNNGGCGYRRDVISFVVSPTILFPKPEAGLDRFPMGFEFVPQGTSNENMDAPQAHPQLSIVHCQLSIVHCQLK